MKRKGLSLTEAQLASHMSKVRPAVNAGARQMAADRVALSALAGAPQQPVSQFAGLQRFQALGRMPVGQLNKTEQAWADDLEQQRIRGEIVWWKAHPFNVRLADNTFYRIDFLVMRGDMKLEIHETKGEYVTDKGQMKIKLCAEVLPVFGVVKMTRLAKKNGGGWKREEF